MVKCGSKFFNVCVKTGVPQIKILGPPLFILYAISPPVSIISPAIDDVDDTNLGSTGKIKIVLHTNLYFGDSSEVQICMQDNLSDSFQW